MIRLVATTALLASTLLAATASAAPPPIPVTVCGQVVPARALAVLASDLDCTGENTGVSLGRGAKLSLGGFTLSNGFNNVECSDSCTVTGPGSIAGGQTGVVGGKKVVVSGVTISGAAVYGVSSDLVELQGSTVTDSAFFGVSANRAARITGSTISGGFGGVSAGRAIVKSSTIAGDTFGISASLLSLKNGSSVASGGGPDARAIRTGKKPSLSSDSTCSGLSKNWTTGEAWGVCSLD